MPRKKNGFCIPKVHVNEQHKKWLMIIQYTTDKIKTNHFNLLDSLSTCISKIFLTDNLISNLKATGPF